MRPPLPASTLRSIMTVGMTILGDPAGGGLTGCSAARVHRTTSTRCGWRPRLRRFTRLAELTEL